MKLVIDIKRNVALSPVPWGFFFLTLFLHIIWPLTSGSPQATLTTLAVFTLALSSLSAAIQSTSTKRALLMFFGVTLAAFFIEKIGSTTGIPFGEYSYTEILQPQLFNVPVSVITAWFAMTWVMCVFVHDVALPLLVRAALSGLLLTAWDFYLDPQMTSVQYWVWSTTTPSLPGIPGIPLTNYLGWFLSGMLMSSIVLMLMQKASINRTLSKLVLLWTITGGFILHAIFWRDIFVGLWGLLTMGLIWLTVERLPRTT